MKKVFTILLFALASIFIANAQQWVNFSSSVPKTPESNVLISNAQTVSYEIEIFGIFSTDTTVNGVIFNRLKLPGGEVINPTGSPEIPVLTYKIAIPDCTGTEVEYQVISRQTMNSAGFILFRKLFPTENSAALQNCLFSTLWHTHSLAILIWNRLLFFQPVHYAHNVM